MEPEYMANEVISSDFTFKSKLQQSKQSLNHPILELEALVVSTSNCCHSQNLRPISLRYLQQIIAPGSEIDLRGRQPEISDQLSI